MPLPWERDWAGGNVPQTPAAASPDRPAKLQPWEQDWTKAANATSVPTGTGEMQTFGSAPAAPDPTLKQMKVLPFGGNLDIPPELQGAVTNIHDTLAGFNGALANFLGGTLNTVAPTLQTNENIDIAGKHPTIPGVMGVTPVIQGLDTVLKYLGTSGFLENPTDAKVAMKQAFKDLGIAVDPVKIDSFAQNLGENSFQNLVLLGALFAGSPQLAALRVAAPVAGESMLARAPKVAQEAAKAFGEIGKAAPGKTLALEASSTLGQTEGERVGGPLGGVIGSIGGAGALSAIPGAKTALKTAAGVGGSLVGSGAGMMGGGPLGAVGGAIFGAKAGVRNAQRLMEAGTRAFIPKAKEALADATSPQEAGEFAKTAIEGDKAEVVRGVQQALDRVGGKGMDPERRASRLQEAIHNGYVAAQKNASKLWEKVDMKLPMVQGQSKLVRYAKAIDKGISFLNPSARPQGGIMDSIYRLGAVNPKTGEPRYKASMKDFQGLSSEIGARIRSGEASDSEIRNLSMLQDAVTNLMVKEYPLKKELRAARDYTKWVHETFTRGPLGRFTGREVGTSQQAAASPGVRAQTLVKDPRAGGKIAEAAQSLANPQMVQEAEAYVQSAIQDLAAQAPFKMPLNADPNAVSAAQAQAASRYMARPEVQRFVKNFPAAEAKLREANDGLREALATQKTIERSAFSKLADSDPETFVGKLFNDPKKAQSTEEVVARLAEDPKALKGFRNEILGQLFDRGKSVKAIGDLLKSRDIGTMVYKALGWEQSKRLNELVAAGIEQENKWTQRGGLGVSSIFGRLFGSEMMAKMGKPGQGGNIVRQSIGAKLGDRAAQWMMGGMPPREIFARAVLDPQWERVLFSRSPRTLEDINHSADMLRRTIGAIGAGSTTERRRAR